MALFKASPPLQSGWLPKEDGHEVWWQTFGDVSRPAVVLLHGGPGAGTSERLPRLFDPERWHIVTLDQRGSGRSRPHAGENLRALHANTTDCLVSDLERLRSLIGVERWTVYGASWGTTLAQAYAHAHKDRVTGLILAAVTTTGQVELDQLYGGAGMFLPEAFEAFRAGAPDSAPGVGMAEAHATRLASDDPGIAFEAARAWCRWEEAVLQVDPRAEPSGRFDDPVFRLGFARIVTHYFRHLAWLDPPLLDRAGYLAGLPVTLINSRLDLSCPLSTAWSLHRALPGSVLKIIPGSLHGTLYGPLAAAIIEAGGAHAEAV
ncbi:alpha/beta fold hydrolase [Aestuariibius sp. 2305UL40-4]|uniref:alpha/beta fold hydrolase n=1 Tax=Aestuariibius violaceus TaxID=3234132 RepID=UPI00345E45C6